MGIVVVCVEILVEGFYILDCMVLFMFVLNGKLKVFIKNVVYKLLMILVDIGF